MSQWHATLANSTLELGAKLTILSQHQVVRVMTSDTLSIETPSGQRFSAQVLDRTDGAIKLALHDGALVALEMLRDESLHPPGKAPFSSQIWMVH